MVGLFFFGLLYGCLLAGEVALAVDGVVWWVVLCGFGKCRRDGGTEQIRAQRMWEEEEEEWEGCRRGRE